jgi:hypothetical protein
LISQMAGDRHEDPIGVHIGWIANRSEHDARRFAAAVAERCWTESSEGSVPAALEWLRQWGPRGVVPAAPTCSCRVGRCTLCN